MKIILVVGLLSITFGFAKTNKQLMTTKYAGVYKAKKGSIGSVTVYPETDSTILFYIDISKGAPSYNLGQLYARLKIKDGEGIYFSTDFDNTDEKKGCKWQMTIKKQMLTIKTLEDCYECGFGANVIGDNQYTLKNSKIPQFFIDGTNNKIFFSKTSPKDYFK